jgi:hypothetical protein
MNPNNKRLLRSKAGLAPKPKHLLNISNAIGGVCTHSGPQLVDEPSVDWTEYACLEPGVYSAYCKSAKWYWEKGFKRWTCMLRFEILAEGSLTPLATIPMWLSGGEGEEQPSAGRRSRYFIEWVRAKGGPPVRRDRLSPRVFIHRMAKVRVADTSRGPVPYSVVREILEWSTGSSSQSVTQSREA